MGNETAFAGADGEGGGADFEGVAVFVLVGFAEEEVESCHAVLAVHRLPFGVDYGSIEPDFARDGSQDVIGALAELELDRRIGGDAVDVGDPDVVDGVLAQLLVGRGVALEEDVAADAPDSGVDLARHEERDEEVERAVHQLAFGANEVVFVATEGVSSEVVDRVIVDGAVFGEAEVVEGLDDQPLTSSIIGDEVFERLAFGGGVLEVRTDGVDVEPCSVKQEPAAFGGFKDIVSSVVVDQADLLVVKEVVFDLFDDLLGITKILVGDEAPELRFHSENPLVHVV